MRIRLYYIIIYHNHIHESYLYNIKYNKGNTMKALWLGQLATKLEKLPQQEEVGTLKENNIDVL